MKQVLILMLVLVPLALMSISLTDYTNPVSFGREAFLNGNFNFHDGNQDQASYNGLFGGNYLVYYNSLPFNWKVEGDVNLTLMQDSYEGAESETGYMVTLGANADKYINDTNIFGYGSLDLGYRKQMAMDDADDPYVKIGIGGGYGRVIDATVLARAMRIVNELIKYNVIRGELSNSAYIELGQIIEKKGEYITKYGSVEYQKYWYEAMEDVFNKEGVLRDGSLHALGIVRLQEVLDQRISTRRYGWTARAGVGYILSAYDGSDPDPTLDASFEYAHPFSYKLQFIEALDFSTVLGEDPVHHIMNQASLTYELTSLIDWENKLSTSIDMPTIEGAENIISNTLETAFYYYITNKVNLNTSLKFHMYDDGIDDNGNDDLETTFFLGASYRLK